MNSRRESPPKLKFLACFNFRRLPLVLSRVDCCHYGKSSQFRLNMIRFLASLAITWASDYSARQRRNHTCSENPGTRGGKTAWCSFRLAQSSRLKCGTRRLSGITKKQQKRAPMPGDVPRACKTTWNTFLWYRTTFRQDEISEITYRRELHITKRPPLP